MFETNRGSEMTALCVQQRSRPLLVSSSGPWNDIDHGADVSRGRPVLWRCALGGVADHLLDVVERRRLARYCEATRRFSWRHRKLQAPRRRQGCRSGSTARLVVDAAVGLRRGVQDSPQPVQPGFPTRSQRGITRGQEPRHLRCRPIRRTYLRQIAACRILFDLRVGRKSELGWSNPVVLGPVEKPFLLGAGSEGFQDGVVDA